MDTRQPIIAFPSAKSWEEWLAESHNHSSGIWLRFFKKTSGVTSVSHDEALDEGRSALHGWIDGQIMEVTNCKKPETRQRRLETIIEMLAKGEKFHG